MFKNKVLIVDNFFDNFDNIQNEFKKVNLYNIDEFEKKYGGDLNYPGRRSDILEKSNPFLFNLILKELSHKIGKFFDEDNYFTSINSFIHLRLEKEQDWIHTDPAKITMIVYLSETNFNSGTAFYDEKDNLISESKYIKNRAVLFDGKMKHSSINNFGTDINNGRLTLNTFFE